MITIHPAGRREFAWAQGMVATQHYLHAQVDRRCRPLAYVVRLGHEPVGCLIFGRPEASRCYVGGLTYGSRADVVAGKAAYDRWEVLNLARVWLDPRVQHGGAWCRSELVPGFLDREGLWRPAVASTVIRMALQVVGLDYLLAYPPVWIDQPYRIRALLSYCDPRRHKGTVYRSAGFRLARANGDGLETWWTDAVTALTEIDDAEVRKRARLCPRGAVIRGRMVTGPTISNTRCSPRFDLDRLWEIGQPREHANGPIPFEDKRAGQ